MVLGQEFTGLEIHIPQDKMEVEAERSLKDV